MKRFLCIGLLSICLIGLTTAMDVEDPVFTGGMLFIGTADDDIGAPSPLLTTAGVSVPLRFSGHILLDPSLYLYGTWYGISGDRPVAVPIEYRDKAWVLGVVIDPAVCAEMSLGEGLSGGLSFSPAFHFRFPLFVSGESGFDRAVALSHFFSAGRWFYPETGLYVTWQATEKVALRLQIKALLPVYHLWDGRSEPFWDDMLVCALAGFSFRPPAK